MAVGEASADDEDGPGNSQKPSAMEEDTSDADSESGQAAHQQVTRKAVSDEAAAAMQDALLRAVQQSSSDSAPTQAVKAAAGPARSDCVPAQPGEGAAAPASCSASPAAAGDSIVAKQEPLEAAAASAADGEGSAGRTSTPAMVSVAQRPLLTAGSTNQGPSAAIAAPVATAGMACKGEGPPPGGDSSAAGGAAACKSPVIGLLAETGCRPCMLLVLHALDSKIHSMQATERHLLTAGHTSQGLAADVCSLGGGSCLSRQGWLVSRLL